MLDSLSCLMETPEIQARGASKCIYIKLNDALARASSLYGVFIFATEFQQEPYFLAFGA